MLFHALHRVAWPPATASAFYTSVCLNTTLDFYSRYARQAASPTCPLPFPAPMKPEFDCML